MNCAHTVGRRVWLSALFVCNLACAAAPTIPTDRSAGKVPFELPPVPETTPSTDSISGEVHVERVAFRGNRVIHTDALAAVAAPFLGRDLSVADVETLRTALTHHYTDHGYINSGVLLDPESPYHDGLLSFLIIEGRIHEVRIHGQKRLRAAYIAERLRHNEEETLDVNLLRERFQRLLDDPLFARVNSRIEPGADLGEAILDVDVVRARPYALSFALNNYRPPSIGEKAYDLSGEVRDLTGFGDVVDADFTGPLNFTGGVGYSFGWQLPLNRYGTAVAISAQRAETVVTEEPLSVLDIRSTIKRQELKLTQPLWSSLSQQFSLGASIAHEENSTVLDGAPFSFLPGSNNGITRAITELA